VANPLTGDFEAVLQVSGATVNRLLASMHQHGGTKDLPNFPHGIWLRIGDPDPIDGMRGNILGQVSVPRLDLIHGVTDRFWLEVAIRARYTADPGTVPIPEFIHGTVRAQYRIDNVDPGCNGWEKIPGNYLWIRAMRDTVSFTGTAVDEEELTAIATATVDPAVADARITKLARFLLTKRFEATPHKVSNRYRRGSMRSLNVGPKRSAVAVPIGLSGDPSSGNIASIDQELLAGKDIGIAVSKDFIMGKIQKELDAARASFFLQTRIVHKEHADWLGGFTWMTTTIDYTIKLNTATAQWIGGMIPVLGVTVPGGLVSIMLKGQARTQKAIFNFDFEVTQLILISFDAGTETFSAVPFGPAMVKLIGTLASFVEEKAVPRIQEQIKTLMENSSGGMTGELSLAARKKELTDQLKTMDDDPEVKFDSAEFTADGVIVRGRVLLSGRRAPVHSFAATSEKDGYTAFESWIPGGRVDRFVWSWKWFNNAGNSGSHNITDRFVMRRPMPTGQSKFGVMLGLREKLPGLDGMGQMCLAVEGVHVHPVTGELVPAWAKRRCKQFGLDLRLATPGRIFMREWVPGPRDPIGPVAEVAVHEVSGPDVPGHGANTLVVRIGDRWNREVAMSLRDGLAGSTRRDAGLMVLILFSDGKFMQFGSEWLSELNDLAADIEAPLIVNEDVRGSWSRAFGIAADDAATDDLRWRLISPTGGVTWAHDGNLNPRDLGLALDDYLFRSPPAGAQRTYDLPLGARLSGAAFESDWHREYTEVEATCPPPPFGRLGNLSVVTFTAANSKASDTAIQKLASDEGREGGETFRAVVFDGATADEIQERQRSLPEGVVAIADPDGAISKRFGVRVWPSSISIDENGIITGFESGGDSGPADRQSSEAS
jgi:hypothetical protein